MKKLILTLACLAIVSTAAAFKNAVIEKLLVLKAKEFITTELVTKIGNAYRYDFGGGDIEFWMPYTTCRAKTYDSLGITYTGDDASFANYVRLRTVAVAHFKKELHEGDTLVEVYRQCSGQFKKELAAQPAPVREGAEKLFTRAQKVFAAIENQEYRDAVHTLIQVEAKDRIGDFRLAFDVMNHCDAILAQNLSAAETVKLLGELKDEATPLVVPRILGQEDFGLVKFAYRRWSEGGAELTKKYAAVIALAVQDVRDVNKQLAGKP